MLHTTQRDDLWEDNSRKETLTLPSAMYNGV